MVALAVAFVRIRADVDRVKEDVDRGLRGAGGEKAAQAKGRSIGAAFSKGFGDGGSTFTRVAATMASKATLAAGAVAAATPAVVNFVAALAPAAGAAIGAIPAVTGLAAASTTLKVAVSGVGDAIGKGLTGDTKAYNKALDKMVPAQANFTRQIVALKPGLDAIQQRVARNFFKPLLNDIVPLGKIYLPLAKQSMGALSTELGLFGNEVVKAARSRPVIAAFRDTFSQTGISVKALRGQVDPLIQALARGLGSVLPLLSEMSRNVAGLIPRFTAWLNQGAKTGAFVQAFHAGVAVLKDLFAIIRDLGAISGIVFGGMVGDSAALIPRIRELVASVRAFFESAKGGQVLADVFATIGVVGNALKGSLGAVLPQIGQSLATAAPVAVQLSTALSGLIIALAPLIPMVAGLATELISRAIPAINGLAHWLTENQQVLSVLAPVIVGYIVASRAMAVATGIATVATRAWSIAVGVARVAMVAWTAVSWLASAPVTAHTLAMRLSASTIGTWVGVKALEFGAWVRSTAQAVAATVAVTANRIATAIATTSIYGFVIANTALAAAWVRTTATTIAATVAQNASKVAMAIGTVATYAAAAATTALGVAWRFLTGPIGIAITAITLITAAIVYLWKNNETFRTIVLAVWHGVQVAISAVGTWFRTTFVSWIKGGVDFIIAYYRAMWTTISAIFNGIKAVVVLFWNGIKVYFNFWRDMLVNVIPTAFRSMLTIIRTVLNTLVAAIKAVWTSIRTGSFDPLRNFITQTLPAAFRTGVGAITSAWNAVKEAARKPVAFVVNSVINPLIGGWNKIAGVFGAPKASTIGGFARGGRIPGAPSDTDNRLAMMTNKNGQPIAPMKVATGEYIVNAKSTSQWLPVLEAINKKRGKKVNGVNPLMDGLEGYDDGGLVGWAKSLAGKAGSVASGIFDAVTDPSKAIKKLADAAISKIPGGGFLREALVGAGHKLVSSVIAKIKSVFSFAGGGGSGAFGAWPSSPAAQRGDSGVWRRVVALIKSTGPISGSFGNAYRPGDPKWHGSGRAVDWMGYGQDALATFLAARKPLELIHRTNNRDYAYTRGKNKGSFNNALMEAHRNHVHIAMRLGGLVERLSNMPALKLLDQGGAWPSGTMGLNASGHTEHVLTGGPNGDVAELKDLLAAILVAIRALGGDVAAALERPTRRAVQLGRGRGPATGGATL